MIHTKENLRRDRGALANALREAGAEFSGAGVKCPFHEDRHASGSIHQDAAGVWRFKCHTAACGFAGDVFDVVARHTGKPVEDQLREAADRSSAPTRKPPAAKPRLFPDVPAIVAAVRTYATVESVHAYADPDTKAPGLIVLRLREADGGKKFTQYQPNPGGGFILGAPPKPWPLYNRTRMRTVDEVVVVEGEKCVEALAAAGVVATTSPCGAGKAEFADWRPLAGKTVYLWPDADPPDPKTGKRTGIAHMADVAAELEKLRPAPRIFTVDCDALNLPPKGDAVDFLATMPEGEGKAAAVWDTLREVSAGTGAGAELSGLVEDTITGARRAIDWPWRSLSRQSKALFPGTTTLICGDPGSAKSFLMLEAFWKWHEDGIPIALYELEDPRPNHMLRVLAQMSGRAKLTDDGWIRENGAEARRIVAEHLSRLESFGAAVTSATEDQPTMEDMAEWVERKCADGCKIIGIDPITYAASSDTPWADDRKFLWRAKNAIERSGARLIIVTHPRKGSGAGKGAATMDDVSGGAAYTRHAQTVLWLGRKETPEEENIYIPSADTTMMIEVDRVIRINKARNGPGTGARIGFNFDPESLTFEEVGLIKKDPKKKRGATIPDPFGAPKAPRVSPPPEFDVENLP